MRKLQLTMLRADDYELAREQVWLEAMESPDVNLTQAQLAALVGLNAGQVSRRLARARANRPERGYLELIEVTCMTPMNGCERHHEMKLGQRKVCLNCGMAAPFRLGAPIAEPAA